MGNRKKNKKYNSLLRAGEASKEKYKLCISELKARSVKTSKQKTNEKKILVESVQTKIINYFMHMFNVSTLYWQSIKLRYQKLW